LCKSILGNLEYDNSKYVPSLSRCSNAVFKKASKVVVGLGWVSEEFGEVVVV